MGVTKRFAIAFAIAAALTAVAGFTGGNTLAVVVFILANVVILALFLYDLIATPAPRCLEAERTMESKLSLNGVHTCVIKVRNTSDHALKVEVTDDLPEHFERLSRPAPQEILPHTEREFTYMMKPLKRGEYVFPRISARYPGIIGFVRRQIGIKTPDAIYRVYPNMKDLSRYSISSLSRSLLLNGLKQVRAHSDNGEFNNIRQYAEGDSIRYVNWKATARARELMVNTYSPERNQYIYVMLDSSRVMNSPYKNILMLDYGINAAFLLADYCIRGGDNIGMEVFSAGVDEFTAAGKGPAQMELLAGTMYGIESRETAADYDFAAAYLASQVKRRSLVFVFTQLFNAAEAERFAAAVKRRLAGHLVCAVTMRDPRIEKMAVEGDGTIDKYKRAAARKFVAGRRKVAAVLNAAGIMNYDVEPDKLSLLAVAAYLEIKNKGIL